MKSGWSANGAQPGSRNITCQTCQPKPHSRRLRPRSRRDGSASRHINNSRKNLGLITLKADHGQGCTDIARWRRSPSPFSNSAASKRRDGKKESQARRHDRACRPSCKPSSTSSRGLRPDAAHTVTNASPSPLKKNLPKVVLGSSFLPGKAKAFRAGVEAGKHHTLPTRSMPLLDRRIGRVAHLYQQRGTWLGRHIHARPVD